MALTFLGPFFDLLKEVVKKAPLTPKEIIKWKRYKAEKDHDKFRKKFEDHIRRKFDDNDDSGV